MCLFIIWIFIYLLHLVYYLVQTVEEDQHFYKTPTVDPKKVYLAEHFDNEEAFKKKWIKSEAKKQGVDENIAKYDGKWEVSIPLYHCW